MCVPIKEKKIQQNKSYQRISRIKNELKISTSEMQRKKERKKERNAGHKGFLQTEMK